MAFPHVPLENNWDATGQLPPEYMFSEIKKWTCWLSGGDICPETASDEWSPYFKNDYTACEEVPVKIYLSIQKVFFSKISNPQLFVSGRDRLIAAQTLQYLCGLCIKKSILFAGNADKSWIIWLCCHFCSWKITKNGKCLLTAQIILPFWYCV